MKKLIRLLAIATILMMVFSIIGFAAPDSSPCIKVSATFQEYKGNLSFGGYNINGYDAYKYTFAAGDKIEYEVYLETNSAGLGYLEVQGSKLKSVDADGTEVHDWKSLRTCGIKDSEGYDVHPATDLTEVAYQKWYKRSITIPKSFEGYTSRHWYLMAFKDISSSPTLPTTPEVYYVRNIKVIGADGQLKLTVFGENERFISATKVEGQGAKLVLTGENQKTVSKASSAQSTSKASSIATSTAGNNSSTLTSGSVDTSNTTSSEASATGTESSSEIVSTASSQASSSADTTGNNNYTLPIVIGVVAIIIIVGVIVFIIIKKKK